MSRLSTALLAAAATASLAATVVAAPTPPEDLLAVQELELKKANKHTRYWPAIMETAVKNGDCYADVTENYYHVNMLVLYYFEPGETTPTVFAQDIGCGVVRQRVVADLSKLDAKAFGHDGALTGWYRTNFNFSKLMGVYEVVETAPEDFDLMEARERALEY